MEKIANMKKEINSIRVKDISQGGLTQGQQTQIARNEQRMTQILEELENLEETLNDSIRESIGALAQEKYPVGRRKVLWKMKMNISGMTSPIVQEPWDPTTFFKDHWTLSRFPFISSQLLIICGRV
ncbi:hypothetical protein PIB30_025339 [Stylosanthes scabra]|uniref:Uncharacterized protein n=1 Tax=Stylosanthes scabra TaxID=79078 RepID=A0ABU6X882_9FABA|nr:hypothetical protein [Stylosanthes scabra]